MIKAFSLHVASDLHQILNGVDICAVSETDMLAKDRSDTNTTCFTNACVHAHI